MKKTFAIFLTAVCTALICACTTTTSDRGYAAAKAGKYEIVYNYPSANKKLLEDSVACALSARKWQYTRTADGFDASIDNRGICAKAKISVTENAVVFDTRGSTAAGNPIVPYRYVDFLNKTIGKCILNGGKL